MPFQDRIIFNYCNNVSNVNTDLDISVLQNRLNQLEQKLSEKRGHCIADEQIESIKELEKKENNEVVENKETIEEVIPKPKKDIILADKIRADLKNIGIDLIDKPGGETEWNQLSN